MQSLQCMYLKSIIITLKYRYLIFLSFLNAHYFLMDTEIFITSHIFLPVFLFFLLLFWLSGHSESNLETHFIMHRKFWPCSFYIFLKITNLTFLFYNFS